MRLIIYFRLYARVLILIRKGGIALRKTAKLIASVAAAVTLVASSGLTTISAFASCTNWTIEEEHHKCDYSEQCWNWGTFPATHYVYGTEIRYCDDNGTQRKYSRPFTRKDGCCA